MHQPVPQREAPCRNFVPEGQSQPELCDECELEHTSEAADMELLGRLLGDVRACVRYRTATTSTLSSSSLQRQASAQKKGDKAWDSCAEGPSICRRGAKEVSKLLDKLVEAADRLAKFGDEHMTREEVVPLPSHTCHGFAGVAASCCAPPGLQQSFTRFVGPQRGPC